MAPPGRRAEANLPHWLLIGGGRHGQPSHVPRVAELTADPQYSSLDIARDIARSVNPGVNLRATSVPACHPVEELNTDLKLLFFFQKELNTIPPKYMLRRAQTNQQKLLNLEMKPRARVVFIR